MRRHHQNAVSQTRESSHSLCSYYPPRLAMFLLYVPRHSPRHASTVYPPSPPCLHSVPLLCLLRLLRLLCRSSLTSSLGSLRPRLRVHHVVPPSEAARIVANEPLVVHIVMLRSRPERQEVVQAPREFVPAVGINGLEETRRDPQVHGHDVQLARHQAPDNRHHDGPGSEHHRLDGRGVLRCQSKGRRVLVVDLVHVAVEEAPVEESVHPVMPCILQDEEDGNLHADCLPRREGNTRVEPARLGHGMKEPDLGQFDCKVREEDQLGASPLFSPGRDLGPLNLVLVEVGDLVDDDPGQTAAKVDRLVHDETHDTSREDIILHVGVPTLPFDISQVPGGGRRRGQLTAQSRSKRFRWTLYLDNSW
jgi:hypothetical protein